MTQKLTAKPVIKEIYSNIRKQIELESFSPKLVVLMVGEDPAALYYVQNLEKKGAKVGITVETRKFDESISQTQLLDEIDKLNNDNAVHGLMLQKPLPGHINESEIENKINPEKDMDGFHPVNMGNLVLGGDGFLPSTPAAVIEMLRFYNIETSGRNVVIIGRSNIVGKPLANLLLRKSDTGNATVTVCHSRTSNLAEYTQKADILIAAMGRAYFVTEDMIKSDSVIIDVGVNQVEDPVKGSRYVGDVDYNGCYDKAAAITPVPGGVGSVTTAMLLNNVLIACQNQRENR